MTNSAASFCFGRFPAPRRRMLRDVPFFLQTCQIQRQSDVANVLRAVFSGSAVIFADTRRHGDDRRDPLFLRPQHRRARIRPKRHRRARGLHRKDRRQYRSRAPKAVRPAALYLERHRAARRLPCKRRLCARHRRPDLRGRRLTEAPCDRRGLHRQRHQYLEDAPHFIFPQIMPIERADVAAAMLLEGRVVVFMDQIPQGYPPRRVVGLFPRVGRPRRKGLYRLVQALASRLLLFCRRASSRLVRRARDVPPGIDPAGIGAAAFVLSSSVPFSVTAEVLFVETLLAILAEAAVRTPNQMSQTIGLVGGVILGQALLSSNLATAPTRNRHGGDRRAVRDAELCDDAPDVCAAPCGHRRGRRRRTVRRVDLRLPAPRVSPRSRRIPCRTPRRSGRRIFGI